jgi:putative transposase
VGYLSAVGIDNGPEFTSRAFIAWAQGHGIRHILIKPKWAYAERID